MDGEITYIIIFSNVRMGNKRIFTLKLSKHID